MLKKTDVLSRKKINIMLAEDHTSARQAYAAILGAEPNMHISGQAGNGLDLVKLMEKSRPDVVITDLDMPVMSGSKLVEVIKTKFPEVKTIVLSMHNEAEYISQLILDGANAYVPKSSDIEELILAVNRVYTEGYYFNKVVSKIIVSDAIKKGDGTEPVFRQLALSAREQDVLRLLCDEKTNKQIADVLSISQSTVDFHRQSIYKKTQASSVIGLVKYAIKNGITDLN